MAHFKAMVINIDEYKSGGLQENFESRKPS